MTHITHINIKKEKIQSNNTFLSYTEYINGAKRIMYNYIRTHQNMLVVLNTDDVIADIATHMAIADWLWDENNPKQCSQNNYRYKWAIWTIQRNINKHIKHNLTQPLSLNFNINPEQELYNIIGDCQKNHILVIEEQEQLTYIQQLINSQILTNKQKKYIKAHFIDGISILNIAKTYCISRQSVYKTIQSGIKRIRRAIKNGKT